MTQSKILKDKQTDVILSFIKEKAPYIRKIGLTGSYATKEQTESSDLDIVVDVKNEDKDEFWEVAEEVRGILINNFLIPVDFIFYDDVIRKSNKKDCWLAALESYMYVDMIAKIKWLEEV